MTVRYIVEVSGDEAIEEFVGKMGDLSEEFGSRAVSWEEETDAAI